jgi:hypothetical protein
MLRRAFEAKELMRRGEPSWSPLTAELAEGECHGPVGDCLFACLAIWLASATGYKGWIPPSSMRCLAVSELRAGQLELTNLIYDLFEDEESAKRAEAEASLEDLEALMLDRSASWGNETFLRLWLGAVSRRFALRVGAVVKSDTGYVVLTPDQDDSFDVAVALHYVNNDHYRLLAPLRGLAPLFFPEGRWDSGPLTVPRE